MPKAALFGVLLSTVCVSGCALMPETERESVVQIKDVANAIRCELAAVAAEKRFAKRDLSNWNSLVDLDLTLVTSAGVDGKVTVTAPYALATVSATPNAGILRRDTTTSHIQFSTAIDSGFRFEDRACIGEDPSETRMGLAEWFRATLVAANTSITGASFTKQFQIVATAGVRFGYTLVPVNNPVSADAGGGGSYDYTHRVTVALAPPPGPIAAIPVYEVKPPKQIQSLLAAGREPEESPKARAVNNPTLRYMLARQSPVKLAP